MSPKMIGKTPKPKVNTIHMEAGRKNEMIPSRMSEKAK
jgi:hypothetical protein